MTETVITSVIAYISTNIDDLFILMLLFAQAAEKNSFQKILLGRYFGIGFLMGVSLLGALGLALIPEHYLRFLGIIPIFLGIKAFWDSYRETESKEQRLNFSASSAVLNTALLTIANGADNIGVYIPLFVGYSLPQMLVMLLIFMIMTLLWCILGKKTASLALVNTLIEKYKTVLTPLIYILLGIYILIF